MRRIGLAIIALLCLVQVASAAGEWPPGWGLRRKITIDCSKIGSDLTHFPVPIFLGTNAGQNSADVSSIFDVVGSNWLKIAVTSADGTNELYVEKEQWDSDNEEAVLWVSAAGWSISSNADTDLYLYYDKDEDDNTAHVGAAGSRTEVWDPSFVMVWHLAELGNGTAGEYVDSTSNNNDGTGGNGNATKTPTQIDGKIGKGQDFVEPDDDRIELGWGKTSLTGEFTMQQWFSMVAGDLAASTDGWGGQLNNSVLFQLPGPKFTWVGPGNSPYKTTTTIVNGNWNFGAQKRLSDNTIAVRLNTSWVASKAGAGGTYEFVRIGDTPYQGPTYPGNMDEFRVSTTGRSTDWLNADYYSHSDNLLTLGDEELTTRLGTITLIR